ncbi:MAG: HD domain-containing protein [Pseudomonadota bacterium]
MQTVSFREMKQGTKADYELLMGLHETTKQHRHVDSILDLLVATGGPEAGYQVTRLTHSLQTATRAELDGADEEWIVAALLHDIGDLVAPDDHAALAASLLRPYVSEKVHWVVDKHGIFQGLYFWHHIGMDQHAREKYRDHPWFDACAYFCEAWDQAAFDPDFETKSLEHFEPMVRRIFAREPFSAVDGDPKMTA